MNKCQRGDKNSENAIASIVEPALNDCGIFELLLPENDVAALGIIAKRKKQSVSQLVGDIIKQFLIDSKSSVNKEKSKHITGTG